MTRDELVASALVLSFASLVTVHAAIVAGLARRRPRWRAALALIAPPLAPWWGYRDMRVRVALWVAGAIAYGALRLLASR
jgi:hypothetical protein